MAEDLSAPLGRKKQRKNRRKRDSRWSFAQRLPIARGLLAILFLVVAGIIGRILLADDPNGGRPFASIDLSQSTNANDIASRVATDPRNQGPSVVVEQSGGPSITIVSDDLPDGATDATVELSALAQFGLSLELIEETQNGPIPQVGPNGETPFATYSRATAPRDASDTTPRIAVIITGMGLSESGTLNAIETLPDDITLAFAPYGRSVMRTSGAARVAGHEFMLEIPLEPFDYPENDPGPQTLLTGQPPRANLDRLFWLMARMGGYTGLINHMGARFSASAADFSPIMEELNLRGLAYMDDGSSKRSIAGNLARNNRVPFARANVEIDATPSRNAILTALSELEQEALKNGTAIGIATALPVSIQTIAEWARELSARDITLVPVSALMSKPEQ